MHSTSKQDWKAVGLAEVNALRRAGLVSTNQYLDAIYQCREPEFWTRWALRALLALAVGHLLAGIVFFFAYNWNSLPLLAKFGILEFGVIASALAALIVKIDRIAGQMLLIAATILVGTLLAGISQAYQTGANAYELFTLWALLTVPFVVASRSAPHWFVWLIIAYIAFILYATQVLMLQYEKLSSERLLSLLALTTLVILATREIAVRSGAEWLDARWTRLVLAFAAMAFVFVPAVNYVLNAWVTDASAFLTFIVIIAATAFVFVRLLPDFAVLAITTGLCSLFLMAVGTRLLKETIGFDGDDSMRLISALVLLTLWCAAMTAATVKFLTILRRQVESGAKDD